MKVERKGEKEKEAVMREGRKEKIDRWRTFRERYNSSKRD